MANAIDIAEGVFVPDQAVEWRAVRSGGPGGQNVNKVASKVELRVDLAKIEGLHPDARARLAAIARLKLDANGLLLVTSQRTRDQLQNLEDAKEKVRAMVHQAMIRPIPRRATRPTRGSVERRIDSKKRNAITKKGRRGDHD